MLKKTILIPYLFFHMAVAGVAQEHPLLQVEDFSLCTAVEDRQPKGIDSVFTNKVERLYCYTTIKGATDTTTIYHVWKFGDEVKAKIALKIGAESWRTWSNKRIVKEWTGKWYVEILTKQGDLLAKKEFRVKN
jgi:hypothetical protein